MGRLLFLIFLIVPLIEIGLFISMGQWIGLWPTLLGVVVTALIGSIIVRQQGLAVLADISRQMRMGALPAGQLADGVMIAIAGALLLTPGYFTDTCGFLLLVPAIRAFIRAEFGKRMTVMNVTGDQRGHRPPGVDDQIDLDDDHWRPR